MIAPFIEKTVQLLDAPKPLLSASLSLAIRLWLAIIFWQSGLTKIANWETTLFLFEEEYQVPLLAPALAAQLATAAELIAPIMLVVGYGTRFAAIALLVMTAVIEFTYQSFPDHAYWAAGLLFLIFGGAGYFSWDCRIRVERLADLEFTPGFTTRISGFVVFLLSIATLYEAATALGVLDYPSLIDQFRELFTSAGDATA